MSADSKRILVVFASISIVFIASKDKSQAKDFLVPIKTIVLNLTVILDFVLSYSALTAAQLCA